MRDEITPICAVVSVHWGLLRQSQGSLVPGSLSRVPAGSPAQVRRSSRLVVSVALCGGRIAICVPTAILSLQQKAAFYGIGIPTAAELTCVNNHFPLIFFAIPSRFTWLFAVQKGRPVAEFKDTSK